MARPAAGPDAIAGNGRRAFAAQLAVNTGKPVAGIASGTPHENPV